METRKFGQKKSLPLSQSREQSIGRKPLVSSTPLDVFRKRVKLTSVGSISLSNISEKDAPLNTDNAPPQLTPIVNPVRSTRLSLSASRKKNVDADETQEIIDDITVDEEENPEWLPPGTPSSGIPPISSLINKKGKIDTKGTDNNASEDDNALKNFLKDRNIVQHFREIALSK